MYTLGKLLIVLFQLGAIQLPPNSTGTVVDTNTVASKDREVVNIGDPSASNTAAVTNTAPGAAAQGLVTRSVLRNAVDPALTTANLGVDGVFTSSWFAAGDGGDMWVEVAVRASHVSATDGFKIEESDATADANFTRTAAQTTVSANTTTFLRARVRAANWRVNYTNGGTAQTSFRVAYRTASSAQFETFADYDTGTGIQPAEMVGIALPGAGGPVAGGTAANPVRTDPTGTTTQPVSAASLPLPTGAATAANQLPDGHNVTVDNAAGASAVNIQDGGNSITVDGTVTANLAAGANNIGDVDIASPLGAGTEAAAVRVTIATDSTGVLSVDDNAGSLTVDNATLSVTGGGAEATAMRVTIANDSTGVVSVDDNSGSLTVDGTVTANLAAGTNNIGDVDVASFAAGAITEVQGDVAHDAAVGANPVAIGGRANANEPTAVADGDATHAWFDTLGRLITVGGHPSPEPPVSVNATATGDTTVIAAPGAGVSLYIKKGSVHNRDVIGVVALTEGAAGTVRWRAELAADGGGSLFNFGDRGWKLPANTALVANLATTGNADINVTEYYIAA